MPLSLPFLTRFCHQDASPALTGKIGCAPPKRLDNSLAPVSWASGVSTVFPKSTVSSLSSSNAEGPVSNPLFLLDRDAAVDLFGLKTVERNFSILLMVVCC